MNTNIETLKTDLIPQDGSKIQEPPYALPYETILHGKYLIGRVLGYGGFGITYQGMNIETNQFVAIKEYYPNGMLTRYPGTTMVEIISNAGGFSREKDKFLQEARIIYRCQSSNIIKIYSLFEENNTAYYVMEFLEGRDLMNYLKSSGGRISWDELCPIAGNVMDALELIHKEGVIHRDISPDNIYLCLDNTAKIIDFGTARSVLDGKSKSVILKKGYAPIEQYSTKGTQGPWTDVYALGATLYRALTGILPPEAVERQHHDTIKAPSMLGVNLPNRVDNAIMRAMNVREADRFQSIAEFRQELFPSSKSGFAYLADMFGVSSFKTKEITDTINNYINRWARVNPVLKGVRGVYAGQTFALDQDIIFGRDINNCNVIFPSGCAGISRIHCKICLGFNGQKAVIIDCNSKYGTYLNGMRLYPGQPAILQTGSTISFGVDNVFMFEL